MIEIVNSFPTLDPRLYLFFYPIRAMNKLYHCSLKRIWRAQGLISSIGRVGFSSDARSHVASNWFKNRIGHRFAVVFQSGLVNESVDERRSDEFSVTSCIFLWHYRGITSVGYVFHDWKRHSWSL